MKQAQAEPVQNLFDRLSSIQHNQDMTSFRAICPALLIWLFTLAISAAAPELPKPTSRTTQKVQGWTVKVDDRLLSEAHSDLGKRALDLLSAKLSDITYVAGPDRLEKLQQTTIVLDLTHGQLRSMQYHPSVEWLVQHGYEKDLARCVHICDATDFARARQVNEQPWVVLHELAHAYHDQVLGFDEPRILEAYQRFKEQGRGENVLLYDGSRTRHYGLTDPKEFFAEFTEAYFGLNDFYPFNRAELMAAEPAIYGLMKEFWGPINTKAPLPK